MRRIAFIPICLTMFCASAWADACRNPQALGTSRTIAVSPTEYPKLGNVYYSASVQLPLREREVVLTFDDGPLSPYTEQVLDTLAKECVKATFFLVGRQASANPALVRRIYNEGHSIGTHSQNHPLTFDQMPIDAAQREIDDGIASVGMALGDQRALSPFFRLPGLLRVTAVEDYLASRTITLWSTDFDADDWYRTATPDDIVKKSMARLDSKGRGILLLHDVQPATAMAVPTLLAELKARGYKVVLAVPPGKRTVLNDKPAKGEPAKAEAAVSEAAKAASTKTERQGWPRTNARERRDNGRLIWHSKPPPNWIY